MYLSLLQSMQQGHGKMKPPLEVWSWATIFRKCHFVVDHRTLKEKNPITYGVAVSLSFCETWHGSSCAEWRQISWLSSVQGSNKLLFPGKCGKLLDQAVITLGSHHAPQFCFLSPLGYMHHLWRSCFGGHCYSKYSCLVFLYTCFPRWWLQLYLKGRSTTSYIRHIGCYNTSIPYWHIWVS